MNGSRRQLRLLRIGFVCAIGCGPLLLTASAPAAQGLGGWNTTADANVVDIVIDNATGLAGVHPFTEADLPEAQSSFQTGPFGSGLAAVFWPGSAGGNFGSLSAELPIPSQLQPILSKTNDPIRASAQYPTGPTKATYPSSGPGNVAEMTSTASATGTTATAALTDINEDNLIIFSGAKGTSSSTATTTATATSSSDLGGIALLGGLIDIGGVTSTAKATSDGHTASGSSTTNVSDITVLGQKASIGAKGLVLPTFSGTGGLLGEITGLTGPIEQDLLSQVVRGLGLTVTEFPSSQTTNGATESVSSGGLKIEIDPPPSLATTLETAFQILFAHIPLPSQAAIIPTLPGLLQGATLTITIGRSTATADGSPPFTTGFTPPPVTTPSTYVTSPVSTGSYLPGSSIPASPGHFVPGTPGSTGSSAPTSSGTPSSGPPTSTTPASNPSTGNTKLIDLSSPLGAGAVVLGILVAAALGFGLFRLARMLLPEDVAPICPLGQDNP